MTCTSHEGRTVFLFKCLNLHHSNGLYRMYYPPLVNTSNVLNEMYYSIVLNFMFGSFSLSLRHAKVSFEGWNALNVADITRRSSGAG